MSFEWIKRALFREQDGKGDFRHKVHVAAAHRTASNIRISFRNVTFRAVVKPWDRNPSYPVLAEITFGDEESHVWLAVNPAACASSLEQFQPPEGFANVSLALVKALTAALATGSGMRFRMHLFDNMKFRHGSLFFRVRCLLILTRGLSYYEKYGFVYDGLRDTAQRSYPEEIGRLRQTPAREVLDAWRFEDDPQWSPGRAQYWNDLITEFKTTFREELAGLATVKDLAQAFLRWTVDETYSSFNSVLSDLCLLIDKRLMAAVENKTLFAHMHFEGNADDYADERLGIL